MPGHIWRVEPLQRENTRPGSTGSAGTHRFNAPLHVGDASPGGFHRPGRTPDIVNALKDCRKIMGIEGENLRSHDGSGDLTLGHGTNVADPLREDEIGLERFAPSDID